jgi:hypothetical protein
MLLYTDIISGEFSPWKMRASAGSVTHLWNTSLTGDEMVSDGFKIIDVDDIAYEVDCSVSLALVKCHLLVSHSWLVTV